MFTGSVSLHEMKALDEAHSILSFGIIEECKELIPDGHCKCCTFDPVLGNWIGLLPPEANYLMYSKDTDQSKWTFSGDGRKLECSRGGPFCRSKPLDCKMYPYFPYEVVESDDFYFVKVIVGFPKCRLGTINSFQKNRYSYGSHLFRVAQCAIILHHAGWMERLSEASSSFKGYDEKDVIRIPKCYRAPEPKYSLTEKA